MNINKSTPAQYWRESIMADRGYSFVRWDGEDTIWKFKPFSFSKVHFKRVKPSGDVVDENVDEKIDENVDENVEENSEQMG